MARVLLPHFNRSGIREGEASGLYEALHCRSQIACMLLDSCLHSYLNDQPLLLEQYVHEANFNDERGVLCGLALDRVYAIDTAIELTLDRSDPRYRCPGSLNFELIKRAFRLPFYTLKSTMMCEALQWGIYGKGEFTFPYSAWDGRLVSRSLTRASVLRVVCRGEGVLCRRWRCIHPMAFHKAL